MTSLTSFFGALTGSSLAATVLAHMTVAGVTMVGANLLAPKVDFGSANTRRSLNVRGRNQRNATTNRQYIYGQVKVGGTVAYMGTSGTDNAYLHMVLVHCDHEVEELGDLYVNGELVPMASGGEGVLRTTDITSGSAQASRYNGSLYIADHLGGPSQTTADSTLDAAMGDIDSADAFKGMAYTYIRMELKQPTDNDNTKNAFPSGVPQFQRVVKGMKVYDPREVGHDPADSTTWEYSSNWALCVAHFLQSDFGYGRYGCGYDEINETELIASANNADETIDELWTARSDSETLDRTYFTRSLSGWLIQNRDTTGTTGVGAPDLSGVSAGDTVTDGDITWTVWKLSTNSANRYELNGIVDSHEDPIEVLRKMKTAASGMVEYVGGEWVVRSGRYIAPTVTLNESDFSSGISGTTKDDRTSAVNTVKGVIVDKHDGYQVIDAPSITNSTFVTQDGGIESVKEMELMYTNSHKTAQRLFKIELNKARQSITHKASFTSKAMQLQVGDTFQLNFAKYGYVNKVFEVWSHQLVVNNGALQVEMEFRETATNVYEWDHTTDETALDPSPNTTLPSAFEVAPPTNLVTASGTAQLVEKGGRVFSRMRLSWDLAPDSNVIAHEVIWRKREYRSIDNITQANPAVVTTATPHEFVDGDIITMWGVEGMTEVIGIPYTVANATSTTLELSGIDSTSYGAYSAGSDWIELDWENSTYIPVPSNTMTLPDVEDGAGYDFKVRAISSLTISDWVALDNQIVVGKTAPPTIPTWSAAVGLIEGVKLTMDEHPDVDFKQFRIFQNTTNSKPGTHSYTTTDTTKTITGLTAGQIYYFWLEAEDTTGNVTSAAAEKSATPSTFGSDLGSSTLSVQMEVGQSGIPADWSDFDMTVGFYVEGASASWTASTPTTPGQYTITGESATPAGVTMLSTGSRPTVGVRGWPVGYGDFVVRKTYYVQYMDSSETLRNFSIDREWHRTQRFVLGPPRFNPVNEPAKGGTGLTFTLNYLDAFSANDGEIAVGGTTFTKPDGTTTTGISENYVGTPYEGAISPTTTGAVGDFLLMWTDTAADTRFSPLTFTHQNVVPIREAAAGGYEVFNNAGTAQAITFAATDVLLAAVWRDDTTTGLTGIERYVDQNPGQSDNFVTGTSGYKIDAVTGNAEFNDVTVRGDAVLGTNNTLVVLDDIVTTTSESHDEWQGEAGAVSRGIFTQHDDGTPTGFGSMALDNQNLMTFDLARGTDFDSLTAVPSGDTIVRIQSHVYNAGSTTPWSNGPQIAYFTDEATVADSSSVQGKIEIYSSGDATVGTHLSLDETGLALKAFTAPTLELKDFFTKSGTMTVDANGFVMNEDLSVAGNGGIVLKGDANLYRSAANVLKTDDSFIAAGSVTALSGLNVGADDTAAGRINIFGGSTGEGGEMRIYNDVSDDDTYDYYRLDSDSAGRFRIGRAGQTDIYLTQDGNTGIGNIAASTTKFYVQAPTYSGAHIKYDGTSNNEFGLRIESNASAGNFESDFANGTTAMLDLYANSATTSGGDFLVARTQSATPVLLVKATGSLQINGTERLPATKPTVTDAETVHSFSDLFDAETACDDLGTKINSILSYLNL